MTLTVSDQSSVCCKMAYLRNDGWKEDDKLKADMVMEIYVGQGLKRTEMLSFFERDFPQYSWSMRSLERRLRHFGIYYTDRNVTVNEIVDAVKKELDGPGKDWVTELCITRSGKNTSLTFQEMLFTLQCMS